MTMTTVFGIWPIGICAFSVNLGWRTKFAIGRSVSGDPALLVVNEKITQGFRMVLFAVRDKAFPLLRYLIPSIGRARHTLNASFQVGKQFLVEAVREHVANREPGQPRDFVDVWLDENAKNRESAERFPVERLPNVLLDLFAGGFETTTTTFAW